MITFLLYQKFLIDYWLWCLGQADQTRQTGFQSGRQANEGGGRSGQTQADGPPRRDNPEAESSKWDDADDNWQETVSKRLSYFISKYNIVPGQVMQAVWNFTQPSDYTRSCSCRVSPKFLREVLLLLLLKTFLYLVSHRRLDLEPVDKDRPIVQGKLGD